MTVHNKQIIDVISTLPLLSSFGDTGKNNFDDVLETNILRYEQVGGRDWNDTARHGVEYRRG